MNVRQVSSSEWMAARRELLVAEKELTRLRDQLNQKRRALPWLRVESDYRFATEEGTKTLAELFGDKRQLLVYHLMLAPNGAPCRSCSFWADHFASVIPHLAQRDASLYAISRAPLAQIADYKRRFGWSFPWASSFESEFNYDFGVSFRPEDMAAGKAYYNFGSEKVSTGTERPGLSAFYRDEDGVVYRTYSAYARGIEGLNATYQFIDLLPKGRDEQELPYPMAWVRYRDEYAATSGAAP